MPPHTTLNASDTGRRSTIEVLGAALLGFLVLLRAQGSFGFYEDEGYNLVKAFLVSRGFPLYDEIYSDQGPLFTWLLALPMLARAPQWALYLIPPLFGSATIASGFLIARRLGGRLAGLLLVVALISSAPFLKFGGSLVINTPALALGSWALWMAIPKTHGQSRPRLIVSGLLLGAAITVKLATVYLFPVVLFATLLLGTPRSRQRRLIDALVWGAAALAPLVAVAAVLPVHALLEQLVRPHTTGLGAFAGQTAEARRTMLLAPGALWLYTAGLAGLGLSFARADRRLAAVLASWLGIVTAWMFLHRPLWPHHLPDFLLPLFILAATGAAIGLRAALGGSWSRQLVFVAPASLLITGVVLQASGHDYWRKWYDNASMASLRRVADAIAKHSTTDDWVLTDRPILSYWSQRRSPPWLALILRKRIFSGGLTDSDLVRGLRDYRPAVIALCSSRLQRFPAFQAELRREYRVIARLNMDRAFTATREGRCRLHIPASAAQAAGLAEENRSLGFHGTRPALVARQGLQAPTVEPATASRRSPADRGGGGVAGSGAQARAARDAEDLGADSAGLALVVLKAGGELVGLAGGGASAAAVVAWVAALPGWAVLADDAAGGAWAPGHTKP